VLENQQHKLKIIIEYFVTHAPKVGGDSSLFSNYIPFIADYLWDIQDDQIFSASQGQSISLIGTIDFLFGSVFVLN
jgi:hypothetical protein